MGHVRQKFRLYPAGLQGLLAREVQFNILDFNGLQSLAQVFRCLINVLLHFCLGVAQFLRHCVEAGFQLLKFRTSTGINPSIEFTLFELSHCLVQFEHRAGKGAAQAQCDQQTENNAAKYQ